MATESTNLRPTNILLIAALFAAHAWFSIGSHLRQPGNLDVYAQLPWMHRWHDPGAFPNDLVMDYFERYHLPPGMRAGYYVLITWLGLDLSFASRAMTVVWYIAGMAMYLAVIRWATRDRPWAVTLAAIAATLIPFHTTQLVLYNPFGYHFLCGLSRAAGPAVLFMAMYGVVKPSRVASNAAIILGAACYPPSFVIAAAVAGLSALCAGSFRRVLIEGMYLLPGLAVAGLIIYLWYPLNVDPRFGPLISREDIAWAPEIVHQHFPDGQSVGATLFGWLRSSWFAIIAVAVLALVKGANRLLLANSLMLMAGVATTIAAYVLWPRLYDIDRYQMLPRNIVNFLAVPAILAVAIERIATRFPKLSVSRLAGLAVGMYLAANLALTGYRVVRARPLRAERASFANFGRLVMEHLADSWRDVRLAAAGEELDPIPMFAERSLLVFSPALFPYHRDFHREMMARYLAIQDAVYATDWAAVRQLRDRYGVRYLSIDRRRFEPDKFVERVGNFVTRTWLPERLQSIQDQGPNQPYLFRDAPPAMVVVEDGPFQLIDLQRVP